MERREFLKKAGVGAAAVAATAVGAPAVLANKTYKWKMYLSRHYSLCICTVDRALHGDFLARTGYLASKSCFWGLTI